MLTEFHLRLIHLGLSQVEAARLFGISAQSMYRYCHGEVPSGPVARLMDIIERMPEALRHLRMIADNGEL